MVLVLVICVYLVAIVIANLSIIYFGPGLMGVTAFLMIGLDLALRDWLHFKLKVWQMGSLILLGGLITYFINTNAEYLAIASAIAFSSAAIADWFAFNYLRGSWFFKAHGSNLSGALIDSMVFPLLAFGELSPNIFFVQFGAKILGGAMWTYLIGCYFKYNSYSNF